MSKPTEKQMQSDMPPADTEQSVAISHYRNEDFESGLRSYAQYRDLGMVEATSGMVRAHVLRFTEPCDPKVVSKLHFHNTQFQMVYVLQGWVKTVLGDRGEITMRQGSSWTQPPGIRHVINDYSDDCELLEVILPAEFETVEV
jgi:mannose-6-phosphate isomerase-like protein (cupin superfamily)